MNTLLIPCQKALQWQTSITLLQKDDYQLVILCMGAPDLEPHVLFPPTSSVSVGTPNWDMTLMLELLNGKSYSVFQRWQDQGD